MSIVKTARNKVNRQKRRRWEASAADNYADYPGQSDKLSRFRQANKPVDGLSERLPSFLKSIRADEDKYPGRAFDRLHRRGAHTRRPVRLPREVPDYTPRPGPVKW